MNNVAQQGLVRFRARAAAPNKSGPTYSTTPATPTPTTNAASLAAGTARVTWGSAWDMDDRTLTYDVMRDNNTLVYSTTGDSNFWTLPKMGFVDKNLPVGSTHTYQVRITDPNGNTLWSPVSNTVTIAGGSPSAYANTVIADGASHFWRLGEPSGTAALDWAGFDDDTLSGGYTRGQSGAITADADAATAFDGNSGYAVNSTAVPGPNVFSVEAWFKTTSTTGGKIVSFGDQPTGTSNNYDRHVYMDAQGKVWFGVYNNGSYTVNTANSLNDGQWHHVVGTMDATGPTLFVDGKKVGHNGGTSSAQPYNGYWRIGGDSPWSGNPYFNGTIDDVAIYPTALPLTKVQQHYLSSGRTLNVPTRPSDPYGQAVWDANPDLYWRLGDTNGTAKDAGPNQSDGTYQGGYTQGQAGAFDGTTNKAVAFNGIDGFVSSNTQYSNPHNYTLEAWFKTASTNGGKIIGFGCSQTGTSSCYDRHIYINNDGKLTFGVWTGVTNTITTPNAVNDGQWHYVVGSQSNTDGLKLYLDGQLVGTNGQTDAQAYDGFWRVGGDNHWGCCSAFLDATIDEAAVYSSVLSPTTIADHFAKGGGNVPNQNPTAAFTHTETDLKVSADGSTSTDPDGTIASYSWNWGDNTPDTTGPTATASHTYGAAGTYTVTLTVTDNDSATAIKTAQVTVTAPPPNQPPTAAFTHTETDLKVSADGSTSTDPDGTIASYSWNWGDNTPDTTGPTATASHTYGAAGTYTVTLTVTDNDSATATKTAQVTVTAPAFLARDDFGRTVANGWGSADVGGAWTLIGGSGRWSVDGDRGLVSLNAGNGYTANLPSLSTTTTDVTLSVASDKPATGGGQYVSVIGRRISTTDDYRAKVQITSTGAVNLWVARTSGGTETLLPGGGVVSGLTYAVGDRLEVRLQVTGTSPTTVRAKVWKSGGTEPTTWTRTATDSTAGLQVAGSVGMYYYLSSSTNNAPVVFSTDGFRVATP